MSAYFSGGGAPAKPAPLPAWGIGPPPPRVVKVRAHTRTLKPKAAAKPKAAGADRGAQLNAINPQSARPTPAYSTAQRFVPHFKGEPVAGFTHGIRNPDGTWDEPGGARAQPGATLAQRPFYTDKYTTSQKKGPSGDPSTQWNAAQVAQAKQIQAKNYGQPGYLVRSLIPGGLNESPGSTTEAVSRAAHVASTLLPGGGVGEAAGIIGFGLKGLRGAMRAGRAAKDVAEVAPKVAEVAPAATHAVEKAGKPPAPHVSHGQEFHGSIPDLAREPGYLYHRAPATTFGSIRSGGLVPKKPVGPNPSGVYFGNEPLQAQALAWKRGGIYFRVKRENVPNLTEKAFGESFTPHSILPSAVEYLGKDGAWHPIAATRVSPAAALAKQHGINIADVKGTGVGGQVLKADVAAHHFQSLSPQQQVRQGMKGARGLRGQQEAGYSVERATRAAKIHAIYNDTALSVAEREHAANAVLRGSLPKVYFGGFKDLTPDTLEQMKATVMAHPTLGSYDKKTVLNALSNAHAGETPTNSELDKIETVFGKATRDSLAKYAGETSKWKDAFFEVGNIPRSLMSSVDVSAVGRQGIGALVNHPIISGRNLPGMLRSASNEAVYQARVKARAARPNAGKYEVGKLAVTDLENISRREEQFASNLAETLTGLGKRERSPVRWSGRAYTDFLAETRADIYDHYDAQFARAGLDVHDPKFIKGLSTMINSITGRGFSLGGLAHGTSGKALNAVLFSPNLMASRFDLLNPAYYTKMPRGLRLLALRHSLATVGAIASTLELARLAGLHVGLDPRSADFAKIKVGNTRIDLAAGYQQTVRMLYQVAVGQSKSSSTGEVINLRSGKYGQKSVTDVLTSFFENKESPLASITSDFVLRGGKNTIGQQMTPTRLAGNYLTPMLGQDLLDIYNEKHGGINGLAWALGAAPLGALGVGLQTYGPPAPKPSRGSGGNGSPYFGGSSSSGGGSPYFGSSSSSGGGSPYFGGG